MSVDLRLLQVKFVKVTLEMASNKTPFLSFFNLLLDLNTLERNTVKERKDVLYLDLFATV